jgi:nucleoside-diphosphate-sugar epimerase
LRSATRASGRSPTWAHLLAEIAGRPDVQIIEDGERLRPAKSEVFELIADARLAKERCGWEPQVSLREGLTNVFEYVQKNLHRYDVDRYTT